MPQRDEVLVSFRAVVAGEAEAGGVNGVNRIHSQDRGYGVLYKDKDRGRSGKPL